MKPRAVFLDRDGTLNEDRGYISRTEDFVFLRGAKQAVKKLKENGFLVFIVSNQSGVGRGYFSSEAVEKIHKKLRFELLKEGAAVDAIYYCPHRPTSRCNCRKPSPTMVEAAASRFGVDLERSYFVGDKMSDVETGVACGCKTVLILPPSKELVIAEEDEADGIEPEFVARDLHEASEWIIEDSRGNGGAG